MIWPEERYARDLHDKLAVELAPELQIQLSVAGRGANWHCRAQRDPRSVVLHCFDKRMPVQHPEYLCSFEDSGKPVVWGRTHSSAGVMASLRTWLAGSSLTEFCERFEFVEFQKRKLLKIAESLGVAAPELLYEASHELKYFSCDLYDFWYVKGDRSCKLFYFGERHSPGAIFYWDQCELFRFHSEDTAGLAAVLKRWLCDRAMPSALRSEFPGVKIGELADYYEQGRPVEGEFIKSWNDLNFDRFGELKKGEIVKFIAELRQHGYDRMLRAGQSMFDFVLSRSRRHGLRVNQPSIFFHFRDAMEIKACLPKEQKLLMPEIRYSSEIEVLLNQLVDMAID